jgi:hypothetical protein
MDTHKFNWAECRSIDASACYHMGRIARQRRVPKEDNPWKPETEFARFWDIGWEDEETLLSQ